MCVVVKQFQEYTEPGSGEDGTPQRRSEDEESVLLPLGDGTLTHNLGIPVVVVCTKVYTHTRTHSLTDCRLINIAYVWKRMCTRFSACCTNVIIPGKVFID